MAKTAMSQLEVMLGDLEEGTAEPRMRPPVSIQGHVRQDGGKAG
jgi:hypothetical protein